MDFTKQTLASQDEDYIQIERSDVPYYLQQSALYRSLDMSMDDPISIPSVFFRVDPHVESACDLEQVLSCLRYWCADTFPIELVQMVLVAPCEGWKELIDQFVVDLPYLNFLPALKKCDSTMKMPLAIKCGHVHVMKYLHEDHYEWPETACELAAAAGHVKALQYLHGVGFKWDEETTRAAAEGGHLACLQYAHEHGCEWNSEAILFAASYGHIACLRYLHEQGCDWHKDTCYSAANNGHLDCLTYAHEHGCDWSASTCYHAAFGGHLNCLKYAHENGCPWDSNTCTAAAERGHVDCLAYAHQNGCAYDLTAYERAKKFRQEHTMQYLCEH